MNNYATDGVDETSAKSNDNCEPKGCATGIDFSIDSVSAKTEGDDPLITLAGDLEVPKAGERAPVAGNLPNSNLIAIVGTASVKVCLPGAHNNGTELPT